MLTNLMTFLMNNMKVAKCKMSHVNVIFDILESHVIHKYSTCWVFKSISVDISIVLYTLVSEYQSPFQYDET